MVIDPPHISAILRTNIILLNGFGIDTVNPILNIIPPIKTAPMANSIMWVFLIVLSLAYYASSALSNKFIILVFGKTNM